MSRDKETEQWKYFSKLMDDYKSGKRGVQPGHPKEIEDAIKTFYTSGIDILALNNYIITKEK